MFSGNLNLLLLFPVPILTNRFFFEGSTTHSFQSPIFSYQVILDIPHVETIIFICTYLKLFDVTCDF